MQLVDKTSIVLADQHSSSGVDFYNDIDICAYNFWLAVIFMYIICLTLVVVAAEKFLNHHWRAALGQSLSKIEIKKIIL